MYRRVWASYNPDFPCFPALLPPLSIGLLQPCLGSLSPRAGFLSGRQKCEYVARREALGLAH